MGSGKSTVGKELLKLGAGVIDADNIVRDLNRPGEPGFAAMVDILGQEVVADDGQLDKDKVSSMMFSSPVLKQEVERVVHPLVWSNMFEEVRKLDKNTIPILEIPLLKPEHTRFFDGVVVVNTDPELAVERLAMRGFTPEQAWDRINTQMTNEERAEMADYVIDNNGTYDELMIAARGSWHWMQTVNIRQQVATR